jgi:hypothetical protein
LTSQHKEKASAEGEVIDRRSGLRAAYEKFVAEGGAGRSNTNSLVKILVDEIEALKETVRMKNK